MLRKTLILAGLAVLTSSCASISKDSCIAGSWESLGYEDGREGESRAQFNKIAKSCAKYGIAANAIDYRAGYENGIQQYCSYDRGLRHGTSGHAIKTECREINSTPYLDGFNEGLPLYCSFDRGLAHGEAGKSVKAQCSSINAIAYFDGHEEGRIIYVIRKEYQDTINVYNRTRTSLEDVSNRLANFEMDDKERRRLRKKERRLERKLDDVRIDIRAFERVQGWPKRALPRPKYSTRP